MAPIVAAMALGGPAVGGWVAAIGTTEMRELRGRIPWYGTLANHAGAALPAIVGGIVYVGLLSSSSSQSATRASRSTSSPRSLAAVVLFVLNTVIASGVLALRTGQSITAVIVGRLQGHGVQQPRAWRLSDG